MSVNEPSPTDAPTTAELEPQTERRLASEIYGLIVASSVLAASVDDDDIVHVAASVLVTLVIYWLAETYAHVMAIWHVREHPAGWAEARHDLRTGWPLVSASFTPLIAVVIASVFGASVGTAQTIGLACATVLLFSSGWIAGRRRGLTGVRQLLSAIIAAGFGIVLIALKTALH